LEAHSGAENQQPPPPPTRDSIPELSDIIRKVTLRSRNSDLEYSLLTQERTPTGRPHNSFLHYLRCVGVTVSAVALSPPLGCQMKEEE
jgi:hypothetical protein